MYTTGVNIVSFLSTVAVIIAVLAVVVLGVAIYRIVKLKRTRKLPFALLSVALILVIVVNLLLGYFP